jgi:glycosyltransferase 2 family protein
MAGDCTTNESRSMRFLSRLWVRRTLQLIFVLLLVIFVGAYLRDQWDQLRDYTLTVDWLALALSQIVLVSGLAALSVANWYVLKYLGAPLPLVETCRIFFVSNVAKYLPGSIWALPGRMFLYQRAGVPTAKSIVAVFWEVLFMVIGAALLALLGWRFLAHYLPGWVLMLGVAVGVLGLVMLYLLLRDRRLRAHLLTLPLPEKLRANLGRDDLWLTPRQAAVVLIIFLLAWLLVGLSFAGMVYAISDGFAASWWVELSGLYLGTWVVGFLIFFTPGGIGVRDVLIGLGMSVIVAAPLPAVVAILARITWTLAEVIGIGLIYAISTALQVEHSSDTPI